MEVKEAPLRGAWPSTPAIAIDQTLRRGRIVEARRLALETSRALQAKYRQALVLEVEEELRQRKVRAARRRAPPTAPCPAALSLSHTHTHAHARTHHCRLPGRPPGLRAWRRCRQCTRARWSWWARRKRLPRQRPRRT